MSAASMGSDWVGQQVNGRYTLLEWLGGTAGGGVFRTEVSGAPGEKAAIHLVPVEVGDAEARLAGWTIAKALPHAHLVRIFEAGRAQVEGAGIVYLVTEYADEVLSEVLRERPLTTDETREMLSPLLEALSYLHGRGFVHGHVKPSNILVVGEHLKLSAEGQVPQHELQKRPALTVYDAPEIGSGDFSAAADMWSLGVTLVKTLTQHAPEWARPAGGDPAIPLSLPEPFAQIARECLRVDPAKRCTLERVKALLEGEGGPEAAHEAAPAVSEPMAAAASPIPAPAQNRPPRQVPEPATLPHHRERSEDLDRPARSKLPVMPLVIVFIVLVGIIVVLYTRSHKSAPEPNAPSQATPAASSEPGPSQTSAGNGETAQGVVLKRVQPDVLSSASHSIRGTLVVGVRVQVDSAGHVTNAELAAPGPSRYFARVALESARGWEFKPAAENGHATTSVWLLRYLFRNGGTDVESKEEKP